jgi:hypothetical protein
LKDVRVIISMMVIYDASVIIEYNNKNIRAF